MGCTYRADMTGGIDAWVNQGVMKSWFEITRYGAVWPSDSQQIRLARKRKKKTAVQVHVKMLFYLMEKIESTSLKKASTAWEEVFHYGYREVHPFHPIKSYYPGLEKERKSREGVGDSKWLRYNLGGDLIQTSVQELGFSKRNYRGVLTHRECHRYQRKAPATFVSVPPSTILCAVILP